jgi:AAA family ATP:ADP antiporter
MMPAPQAASGSSEPEQTFLGYSVLTWQKIIPLGLMFFSILFNYTILRDTKVRGEVERLPQNSQHSRLT